LTLSWKGNREETYDVYSDMGMGYGVFIHKQQVQGGGYSDAGLWPGTSYHYQITGRNGEQTTDTIVTTLGEAIAHYVPLPQPKPSPFAIKLTLEAAPSLTSTIAPATPIFTPVPADTILLGLMSSNDYIDDLGNVVIVGEVRNDSPQNAGQAHVVVTFYDARGEIIQQEETRPLINILKPGQRSPFVLSIPKPLNLWEWSLRATARPTQQEPRQGLVIRESRAREDKIGFYHVVGKVYNEESRVTHLAQVVVTLYDKWGKIVNAGFGYTDPLTIEVGAAAQFDCSFSYFPNVKDYAIQVEWE